MTTHSPKYMPYVAGTLCTLALFLVGFAAPMYVEMFQDFGLDPLPTRLLFLPYVHWCWTLPLGLAVAFALAQGKRKWSPRTNKMTDISTITLAGLILLAFALSVLTPIIRT